MMMVIFSMLSAFAQESLLNANYPNSINQVNAPPAAGAKMSNDSGSSSSMPRGSYGKCNTSTNRMDPNSINNPFSKCGSPFAAHGVNNKVACPGSPDCPNNPYNNGLTPSQ